MALKRWFINIDQPVGSALVKSSVNEAPAHVPSFLHGDTDEIEIQFLIPNTVAGSRSPFTKKNLSGLSIRVAIGTVGGTPAALQTSWTISADGTTASGTLNLNTAEIATLIGTNTDVQSTLSIKLQEAQWQTKVLMPCTLYKSVDDNTSNVPVPTDSYYTKNEADARFVPVAGSAGGFFDMVSPDGTKTVRVYVNNNGEFKADMI